MHKQTKPHIQTKKRKSSKTQIRTNMEKETRKGYKASENGVCRGMLYEVGKTYTLDEPAILCQCGYHYCEKIDDTLTYYPYTNGVTKIFEIEDLGLGESLYDKSVTNKIRIVREIPLEEWNGLMKCNKFDDAGNLILYKTEGLCWRQYEYNTYGDTIKYSTYDGYWKTTEYDVNRNKIRFEECDGTWVKWEYDQDGQQTRYENSSGYWETWEYDKNCPDDYTITRYEDSNGRIESWKHDKDLKTVSHTVSFIVIP